MHHHLMVLFAHHRQEEDLSTAKALQTVSAGQQAENLLDFDSDDILPAQTNTFAGMSSMISSAPTTLPGVSNSRAPAANPIDDLLSLFNSMPAAPTAPPVATPSPAPVRPAANGLAGLDSPISSAPSPPQQRQAAQSDDLLGLF